MNVELKVIYEVLDIRPKNLRNVLSCEMKWLILESFF